MISDNTPYLAIIADILWTIFKLVKQEKYFFMRVFIFHVASIFFYFAPNAIIDEH